MNGVKFRLLGLGAGLALIDAGHGQVRLSKKEQCLLAILLLSAGRAVREDAIIDRIWGERPPAHARDTLRAHVTHVRTKLRRALGDAVQIVVNGGMHAIRVDSDAVDVLRFARLRTEAAAAARDGDLERAIELFKAAEGLCGEEPLGSVPGEWARTEADRLRAELLDVRCERIGLELALGRHAEVLGELRLLVSRHPADERLAAHYLTALSAAGRQPEALAAYQRLRRHTQETLGTEPGAAIRALHLRILRSDEPGGASSAPAGGPRELPGDPRPFVGRQDELEAIGLVRAGRPGAGIVVIEGMAGVGKTALALHAAHTLAPHHPDACLYLDLGTHDPAGTPLGVHAAAARLLAMVGVPEGRVPATTDRCAALWRATVARMRAIVVLDDADGLDAVRPLLPEAPAGLLIVTTRRRGRGTEGVRRIPLGGLPDHHAADLCTRLGMDPALIDQAVRECAGLPLALTRLGARPPGEAHTAAWAGDVQEAFGSSYRRLAPDQRAALRRLGRYPGHDMPPDVVRRLLDPLPGRLVEDLLDHHLVEGDLGGRLRLHPLVRDYARGQAEREDPEGEGRVTMRRVLDHVLVRARAADQAAHPNRWKAFFAEPPGDAPEFTPEAGRAWLTAEWRNVLALAGYAERHEWQGHCADLTHAIAEHLDTEGHRDEALAAHRLAARACAAAGDDLGRGRALLDLAFIECRVGAYQDSGRHAREAGDIFASARLPAGLARSYGQLGLACWGRCEHDEALASYGEAEALYRRMGDERGRANILRFEAMARWGICHYARARALCEEALEIYVRVGDRLGEAKILTNLGHIEQSLAHYHEAATLYRRSSVIFKECTGKDRHAVLDHNQGDFLRDRGDHPAALRHYWRALAGYRDTGERSNEPDVRNGIAATYLEMGRLPEALAGYEEARRLAEDIGCRAQEVRALAGIAAVHREMGEFTQAREIYTRALDQAKAIRDLRQQGEICEGLAEVYHRRRRREAARMYWRRALGHYDEIGLDEPRERVALRLQMTDRSL